METFTEFLAQIEDQRTGHEGINHFGDEIVKAGMTAFWRKRE